jgi:hypothetical protein
MKLSFILLEWYFMVCVCVFEIDTKFKQQKLPAWQPIMTASSVLPAFIAVGVIFIPLGVALLVTSNGVSKFWSK